LKISQAQFQLKEGLTKGMKKARENLCERNDGGFLLFCDEKQ